MKLDLQTVLLIGVIAFLAMRGCETQPGPGPEPTVSSREAAEQSLESYGERLAAVYDAAAEAIDAGKIASDADLYRYTEVTQEARELAFQPFDTVAEREIPDGKWDRDQAAHVEQFCREVAAGFRE